MILLWILSFVAWGLQAARLASSCLAVTNVASSGPGSSVLARVARGDQAAVKQCISQYSAMVWSMALSMSATRSEAEDAVQEIFIALWKNAGRYDPAIASERTFVAMIARRRLIDHLRASRRKPTMDELERIVTPSEQGRHYIERSAEASIAANAMNELADDQRRALELSVYHGMSHSEIAEAMALPLGTVKSHVRRALALVRKRLSPPAVSDRARRSAS
ncbi:MAG: sigma-70 family RNA polymerase sigma factor [Proteobacteria bacterium]|nr:sigma-70 family RNA polymerase sigma factor [Pseudomonadota bacterium]